MGVPLVLKSNRLLRDALDFDHKVYRCQGSVYFQYLYSRANTLMLWVLSSRKLKYSLGLSQICSKFCPICFWEFPKIFSYYALLVFYYACIMLVICYNILTSEFSVRVLYYKVTVLLESIDLASYFQCI